MADQLEPLADPVLLDALNKLGTMLEHRDHIVRYESQQGFDWFLPNAMPGKYRPLGMLGTDDAVRLIGLCLQEEQPYTYHLEDIYWWIIQRLPGYCETPPPDWWLW